MAVSKTTSNHSFRVLLPNIALCTFVAYLKALSWGVEGIVYGGAQDRAEHRGEANGW